jgi:SAM-dependent methyltransferase
MAHGAGAFERRNPPLVDGSPSGWTDPAHALGYLARADAFPRRAEGEGVLLDHVPLSVRRILDLGTGDGRLLGLLRRDRPHSISVGVDVSEPMLKSARERFADQPGIELVRHELAERIPDVGRFDAVVSCFAIHHVHDARKRTLYAEVFDRLVPAACFATWNMSRRPHRACIPPSIRRWGTRLTSTIPPTTFSTLRHRLVGGATLASRTWIVVGSGWRWRC